LVDRGFQRSVARGVAWVSAASSLVAAFDLLALALILQNWATKEDYGTVSVVTTLFGALQLAGEAGLPSALVQRADTSEERRSTMYWTCIMIGVALYGAIWVVSPWFAGLYDLPILVPIFRIVGLVLVVRPLYTTHNALLRRELRFREVSMVRIVANTLEFATKITVAIAVGGPWPFAVAPVVRELTYGIGIPLYARWRPRLVWRPALVRADFRFGLRSTGGELLFQIYSNLDYQVVGYAFGPGALGIYRAAYELVLEPVRFVSGVITVVAFPTFSKLREDHDAIVDQFVSFTRQNLAIVLIMVGVIVVGAEDLLVLTYGDGYAAAADAGRILAIVGAFRAMSHLGPPLLDGVGRPGLTLRYQVVASCVLTTLFVASTWVGDTYLAVSVAWAIGYPIAFAVLWRMVLGVLHLDALAYARRVGGVILWVAIATGCGYAAHALTPDLGATLQLVIAIGVVLGVSSVLLDRFEKLSIRAVMRALR